LQEEPFSSLSKNFKVENPNENEFFVFLPVLHPHHSKYSEKEYFVVRELAG